MANERDERAIAIIGMACRFPGAPDVDSYWESLRIPKTALVRPSTETLRDMGVPAHVLADPMYVPVAGTLDDVGEFDAGYFGIAPADAASMDPQHRLLLQEAVRALADAGWTGSERVGVYVGAGENRYAAQRGGARRPWDTANALPLLVSYHLGLTGPSVFVNTMCSTSLTAVHMARQALLAGDCEIALAGAVSVQLPHEHGYLARPGGVMSPSGVCRPFDSMSDGTVPGSGVGVVVLRRLADALRDRNAVHAVIRGSALNNDGAVRLSFAAPSVRGQRDVVVAAVRDASVEATSIGYVEAHGTGTALGDPVEIAALVEARAMLGAEGPCAIGAVKSSIGHLDEAAGMAGLIKAVLVVREGILPPTMGHDVLSPAVAMGEPGLRILTEEAAWPPGDEPRRAGITSLGIGGTNAHVVVEQPGEVVFGSGESATELVFPMSAHTARSFAAVHDDVLRLASTPGIDASDLSFTLRRKRSHGLRRAVVASSAAELRAALAANGGPAEPGPLVFGVTDAENQLDRLVELGVSPAELAAVGAGAYSALAFAGALDATTARLCASLHRKGAEAALLGDVAECDQVLAEMARTVTATGLKAVDRDVTLRTADIRWTKGDVPVLDDLLEESRAAFMGGEETLAPGCVDVSEPSFLKIVAECWEHGADVNWRAVGSEDGRLVSTAPYPFDPERHWALDLVQAEAAPRESKPDDASRVCQVDVTTVVAGIWQDVLGVPEVHADDSFFALGGHSVLASQLLARLLDQLDVRCALGDLLEAETLEGMVAVVERERHLNQVYVGLSDHGDPSASGTETVEL